MIQIFVFIILVSSVVGELELELSRNFINLAKYEGTWYDIGRTPPFKDDHMYSCGKSEIKVRDYDDQTFSQIHYALKNSSELMKSSGYGYISGNKIYVTFPTINIGGYVYDVIAHYDNYKNIIIKQSFHGYFMILSRHNAILQEAKTAFEELAAHRRVIYFDQINCQLMPK